MGIQKPICVPCQRFYRVKKVGIAYVEGMPNGKGDGPTPPGKDHDDKWQDYKLWLADKMKCPGCGHEIVTGVGFHPVAEHFEDGFKSEVVRRAPLFRVNDC